MASDFKSLTERDVKYPSAEEWIDAWNKLTPQERESMVELNQKIMRKYVIPQKPQPTGGSDAG